MSTAPTPRPPCGTYRAYGRHKKRGEPIDPACREANRRYMADYRARTPARREYDRRYNNARHAALERLRQRYPGLFQRLLDDELAKAEVA